MKLSLPTRLKSSKTTQFSKQKVLADICLLVHNNVLLHAEKQDLVAQHDESLLTLSPSELAEAARRLLPNTDKQQRIALALPASEFVATPLNLPGIEAQNLKSAVMLQLPTLLPGIIQPLSLAIQPQRDSDEATVALWIATQRMDELFTAFDKEGLFLACLLPRPLLNLPADSAESCCIIDEDSRSATCLAWSGNTISQWLHVAKADWEAREFQSQWNQALAEINEHSQAQACPQIHKTQLSDWENMPMPSAIVYGYALIPPGALLHAQHTAQRRKQYYLRIAAGIIGIAILVGIGSVLYYQYQLQQQLRELRGQTKSVSQLSQEVFQIEQYIEPVKAFPHHEVVWVLERLNGLIPKDSWLTELRVELGRIEVKGFSPDAAQLVEIIAEEERFLEVGFSQGIQRPPGRNEEKFGISFRLEGVDVLGYWETHFRTQ